ncbi:MAG: hypothetical protein ACKVOP_05670 [Sphingomonadaceae bacterium]
MTNPLQLEDTYMAAQHGQVSFAIGFARETGNPDSKGCAGNG